MENKKYDINEMRYFLQEYKKLDRELEESVIELIKTGSKDSISFNKCPMFHSPVKDGYTKYALQSLIVEGNKIKVHYRKGKENYMDYFNDMTTFSRISIYNFLYQVRSGVFKWDLN